MLSKPDTASGGKALVRKPSAFGLPALLCLYCLIIPITDRHNNNNAYSSNNMIMRRHPHRDNMQRSNPDNGITHAYKGRAESVLDSGFICLL